MDTITTLVSQMADHAKIASQAVAELSTDKKNTILLSMASTLHDHQEKILAANREDMNAGKEKGLNSALLDRLELNPNRIQAMADGFKHVAQLPDPIGVVLNQIKKPNGLLIEKKRVPIGVIGIIYESRPNVTADVTALCIKTGNAIILRGGSEAIHSNKAIVEALLTGGKNAGLPKYSLQLIPNTNRAAVKALAEMEGKVDLIIPRGGESLIKTVTSLAKVPVIKHYKGVCHIYVDAEADLEMALAICENAKCQRPGVCNAMETLLVHESIANTFLPKLTDKLTALGVELRGDNAAGKIAPSLKQANENDWYTEYLDLILSIKIVNDINEAISHINHYGSHHSDAIISNNTSAQQQFTAGIDSAAVYVNASTRFTDGAEFGMGAEIGISTDKLHARGPMGLEELTTYKYVITGSGQIR